MIEQHHRGRNWHPAAHPVPIPGAEDERAARALARRAIEREFERQRRAITDPERVEFVRRCTVLCFIRGTCGWRASQPTEDPVTDSVGYSESSALLTLQRWLADLADEDDAGA